jgi:hypothetical protein
MSEDESKRKDKEYQYEMTKLQVDFEFAFSVLIGLLAILFGLWVLSASGSSANYLIGAEIIIAIIGLFVVSFAKNRRFKEIKTKYGLFPKTEIEGTSSIQLYDNRNNYPSLSQIRMPMVRQKKRELEFS